MVNIRDLSANATARAKLKWRSRARTIRREIDATFDFAVTVGLFVTGLSIHASSDISESSKYALEVLLGVVEITYLFYRLILKRLKRMSKENVNAISRDRLNRTLYSHLTHRKDTLLERAQSLAERQDCELEKHETYTELIGLTLTVAKLRAGYAEARILAISSTNIEDFEDEPLAEAYLEANTRAVRQHVTVRRLFIIDDDQRRDQATVSIIRKHEACLRPERPNRNERSGVKWILRSQVPVADRTEDFALFMQDVLIVQAPGGVRFEMSQQADKIARALRTFNRLWDSGSARPADQLHVAG